MKFAACLKPSSMEPRFRQTNYFNCEIYLRKKTSKVLEIFLQSIQMRFDNPHIFWELSLDFCKVDYLQAQLQWKVKQQSLQIKKH